MSPSSSSPVFIPQDLIVDVLSFLPVKSVIRFKCMNKTFHSLISNPNFVKLHLHRYPRNQGISFVSTSQGDAATLKVVSLSQNPPIHFTVPNDPYFQDKYKDCFYIVGSCNGLLCLSHYTYGSSREKWFRIWNPATRTLVYEIRFKGDCGFNIDGGLLNLTFSYDTSRDTYKLVRFVQDRTDVKVLKLGDNVWRKIQNSPICHHYPMHFVHFSLLPLCMFEKSDTLLLTNSKTAIFYNWRYNKAESIHKHLPFRSHLYIESLVSDILK
ncbi:F-box/kelch-repeat protein At3g23880-like [Vicia villosa]|uniref:F-box/kelch-repeat protein At3g23880-like n=1 Tax=Vicia villosa TaxID=3911 RepID=UPI00273CB1FD|nr:F-box/kelch-repeat protein At3g23880-like [Vicia villosa]